MSRTMGFLIFQFIENIIMEVWKEIDNFRGYYISNYGNVKSVDRIVTRRDGRQVHYKGKKLHLSLNPNGYLMTGLSVNYKNHTVYPHILVAKYFIEKPLSNEKLIVNHKDGNKTNNNVSNLEWVSYSENSIHSFRELNQKRPHTSGYPKAIVVKNNDKYFYCSSITDASNIYKLSKVHIMRLLDTNKKDSNRNQYLTFEWPLYEKIANKKDVFKKKHGLPKNVLLIKDDKLIQIFTSIKEAGRYLSRSEYIISKMIQNKTYFDENLFMKFVSVEDIKMIQSFVSE